jgi:biotin carboxyl carrier protein
MRRNRAGSSKGAAIKWPANQSDCEESNPAGNIAMKMKIELGGKAREVDLVRIDAGGGWQCAIDGREFTADAVEIASGVFSILIGGEAFEARVEATAGALRVHIGGTEYVAAVHDPRRWRRGGGSAIESQGRQQVLAPMPGQIVRLLAKAGDAIEAGQGIVVVEAMKMQNEVKSPKTGSVERLLVAEGQTVNAGEVLATIV